MVNGINKCTICPASDYCKGFYPVCTKCIEKHGGLQAAQAIAIGVIQKENYRLICLAHTLEKLESVDINIDNLRELVKMTPYQVEKLRSRMIK